MGIQTSTINNGPVSGFKNAVINGNFDFWQRGTSFTNTSTAAPESALYSADRWFLQPYQTSTTHSVTVSRQAFTLGQTDVPNNPNYFLRVNTTAVGTLISLTMQNRIEGVKTFAGQQVTLSLWAKASSATTLSARFTQRFGTGGTPSAAVDPAGSVTTWNVTTSWQRFTLTTTIPSVSGKTIGTNNDDHLMVAIAKDPVTVSSFDIAQVQVEEGPVATDFEQRPLGTELALCQRYYQIWEYPGRDAPVVGINNGDSSVLIATFELPVTMRAYPSSYAYDNVVSSFFRMGTGAGTIVTSTSLQSTARDLTIPANTVSVAFGTRAGWIEGACARSNNNDDTGRPRFRFGAEL